MNKETSYNKVLMKLSKQWWIKFLAQHQEVESPYSFNALSSISYEGRELKVGFNVSQPIQYDKSYEGELFFQWKEGKEARTNFLLGRGNSNNIDYIFNSNTTISGYEGLNLNGQLLLSSEVSDANFGGKYGNQTYGAVFQYKSGEDRHFSGTVILNNEKYKGTVLLSGNETKRQISVDLEGTKHIQLSASSNSDYSDFFFELFWDKNVDKTKSAFFKTTFSDRSILAEMKFINQNGKFLGSYSPTSLYGQLNWGQYNGEVEGRFQLSSSKIELLSLIKSSYQPLSNVRAHLMLTSQKDMEGRSMEALVSGK